ncbi:Hpt domain-containing protein [Neotabrizicola shimadae]|uniref:Hpt domain-containing protein n=1 Tax=Neotabrizicola shimadae TaxID=2807096 RepID=A0A8G0ZUY7_9RHOB|nr:Hpt domain-containing protein [Neotabrizicola shimadae]QYZ69158.1 Hpt domain-containing protein [Neotabrizicola shimadae]
MIDWLRMAELRDEIGQDGFDEVVDVFLEEAGEVVIRLDRGPTLEDLHFLKGSALNLGFVAVAQLCQEGERLLAAGGRPDPQPIAAAFRAAREAVLTARAARAA